MGTRRCPRHALACCNLCSAEDVQRHRRVELPARSDGQTVREETVSLRTIVRVRSRSTKTVVLAPLGSMSSTRRSNGRVSDSFPSGRTWCGSMPGVLSESADCCGPRRLLSARTRWARHRHRHRGRRTRGIGVRGGGSIGREADFLNTIDGSMSYCSRSAQRLTIRQRPSTRPIQGPVATPHRRFSSPRG